MTSTMRAVVIAAAVVGALASCSSGSSSVCLSSEAGEVCAKGGDGQVQFSGDGLEAGSEVRIESAEFGSVVYTVRADGSLAEAGSQGFMSLFVGTEFTFTVTATDDQGDPVVGEITVST